MTDQIDTYARVIADSISPTGDRLTTFEACFHRFVLAEFNTHRVFSRNSASSRAIPLDKRIAVLEEQGPAEPVVWAREQKGMQGGDEVPMNVAADASQAWDEATRNAMESAVALGEMGIHKSIANRLLEPFMWHTVVVTATAWDNFFDQRCSPLAQPEIRVVAEAMKAAYDASEPQQLVEGEWHMPYIENEDWEAVMTLLSEDVQNLGKSMYPEMTKISAARCARVSYLTQDGKRDVQEDLALYDRLASAQPPHWSPMEHVATPWPMNRQVETGEEGEYLRDEWIWFTPLEWPKAKPVPWKDGSISLGHLPRIGNLLGWRSLRTEIEAMRGEVTYR